MGRLGPAASQRAGQSGAAVGDEDGGGGYLFQKRGPRGGGFAGAPLPGQDAAGVAERDQQAPRPHPYAVNEHGMVHCLDVSESRNEVPAPRTAAAEGASRSCPVRFGLRVFADDPADESAELFSASNVWAAPGR